MSKLPSKKTNSSNEEESKKIKTTGKVVKQKKTLEKKVVKSPSPKKKGEKVESVVEEVKPNKPKTTRKSTKTSKVTPIKVTEDNVTEPVTEKVPIMERVGPSKTKRFKEDRYVKISTTASKDDFSLVGRRVQNGELQWAFYTTTNENEGIHYYLDLTKKIK